MLEMNTRDSAYFFRVAFVPRRLNLSKSDIILAVVNPRADSHVAFERGIYLARRLGMTLCPMICHYNPHLSGERFADADDLAVAREQAIEEQLTLLEGIVESHPHEGVNIRICASWDAPFHEGIIRTALREDARFVLKEVHYHSLISRVLFSHTDWQLIRSCPVPLWLVKPETDMLKPVILVAVDPLHDRGKPASLDTRVLSEAFEIAGRLEGDVHVVHVYNPYESPDLPERIESRHSEPLEELTERFELPSDRIHMLGGDITELLPRVAQEKNAALIVMGSVMRPRLAGAMIGSTAEAVLDRLHCDVLVIKPGQFVSPVALQTQPDWAFHMERGNAAV